MISKADFESNIMARRATVKNNAKVRLEKHIDATINAHTEAIAMAKVRDEKEPNKIVAVDIPTGRDSDWSAFERLGGQIQDLFGQYQEAGWIIERDGHRVNADFGNDGPAINVRFTPDTPLKIRA